MNRSSQKRIVDSVFRVFVSLIISLIITVTMILSFFYVSFDSQLPLAIVTTLDYHFALTLNSFRQMLNNGYGLLPTLIACGFFCYIYKCWDFYAACKYIVNPVFLIVAFVFGLLNTSGFSLYWEDSLFFFPGMGGKLIFVLMFTGWMLFFVLAASRVFSLYEKIADSAGEPRNNNPKGKRKVFLVSFIVILLSWLVWIIPYYPASMDNDVFAQFQSWFENPNSHHPWFSTCLLAVCFELGSRLINDNFGVFLYIILRDLFGTAVFSFCIVKLYETFDKKWVCYVAVCFFAITPVFGAYAKHAFKDTLGIYSFCLYISFVVKLTDELKRKEVKTKTVIVTACTGLFTSIIRNNAVYSVIPTAIISAALMIKYRQPLKQPLILILISVFAFWGYQDMIERAGVEPTEVAEALSIPFQQTARTVRDNKESITEQERGVIDEILVFDRLSASYDPVISDPVKNGCIRNFSKDAFSDYVVTWIKMFIKYPKSYFEAGIAQSYAYYAFTPNLPERSGNWNSGMTIFDWIGCNSGYDKQFDFHYIEGTSHARQMLHMWAKVWDKLPIFSMTDVCALYTWIVVLVGLILLLQKRYIDLLPIFPVIMMILTVIASPINDCFRYYAPAAVCVPVLLTVIPGSKTKY